MQERWRDDVVAIADAKSYAAFSTKQTTGGHVWDAARHLLRFLESQPELLKDTRSVLELGAGTGWLGMTLARNVPALERVCLTEMLDGGAFDWLRHNVAQNSETLAPSIETLPCECAAARLKVCLAQPATHTACAPSRRSWQWFGDGEDSSAAAQELGDTVVQARAALLSTPFDLALGSDLVYSEEGMRALVRVFGALAARGVRLLYAHTRYRFEALDRDLLEALEESGLDCEQVDPPASERPDSPPPMSELFPEMRVVVYEIRLRAVEEQRRDAIQ